MAAVAEAVVSLEFWPELARPAGLEPATPGLEGRSSEALKNRPIFADSATLIGYIKRLYFGARQLVPDANLGQNRRI